MIGVVITAAGVSRRFGGQIPKVLVELAGKPVIEHVFDAWRAGLALEGISPENVEFVVTVSDALRTWTPSTKAQLVRGGATRQRSVRLGIDALSTPCDVVLVHDGARPLVHPETLAATLRAIHQHQAAAVVSPVTDSLHTRSTDSNAALQGPVDRARFVAAQTPQGALRRHFDAAYHQFDQHGIEATDEASLLHHAGVAVWPVAGTADNIKITTREDLAIAEALLALRAQRASAS